MDALLQRAQTTLREEPRPEPPAEHVLAEKFADLARAGFEDGRQTKLMSAHGRAGILIVGPGFATYFKRTTHAVQRCQNQSKRRS